MSNVSQSKLCFELRKPNRRIFKPKWLNFDANARDKRKVLRLCVFHCRGPHYIFFENLNNIILTYILTILFTVDLQNNNAS
jgi:hypothetical protein